MYQNTALTLNDGVLLLRGLGVARFVFAVSFAAGFVLPLVRRAPVPVLAQLVAAYVEIFHNSPLLVQLL